MKNPFAGKKGARELFFIILRATILLSIIINILTIVYIVVTEDIIPNSAYNEELALKIKLLFLSLIVFMGTFLTGFIEKKSNINIPDVLEAFITLFIYAGIFLSTRFNLYYKYFWWDDFLHTMSGVLTSSIAFLLLFLINHHYSLKFNPLLIAIFTFCFSMTMGVFWEILEFTLATLTGSDHQKWSLPDTARLIGKPYQGSGLRDTMSDLILMSISSFVMSAIYYVLYKGHKAYVARTVSKALKENIEIQ